MFSRSRLGQQFYPREPIQNRGLPQSRIRLLPYYFVSRLQRDPGQPFRINPTIEIVGGTNGTAGLRNAPFGFNPAAILETIQRGIKETLRLGRNRSPTFGDAQLPPLICPYSSGFGLLTISVTCNMTLIFKTFKESYLSDLLWVKVTGARSAFLGRMGVAEFVSELPFAVVARGEIQKLVRLDREREPVHPDWAFGQREVRPKPDSILQERMRHGYL